MNLPPAVENWCRENDFGTIQTVHPVSGGCINQGARLQTSSGQTLFLKQNPDLHPQTFHREAEGLRALVCDGGPRLPRPFLAGERFLLLEDLRPARRAVDYWQFFGRQLATLHAQKSDRFGFEHDNFLGSSPQPNPRHLDGHAFFAEQRLLYQADLARRKGLLEADDHARLARLAGCLPDLIPDQPASLLHGDLWSGNAISASQGEPAIIDPAAHYGWAEAELGMTDLFGGFPQAFYQAYEETRPLASGWRQRLPIYNLYHLLNHLNLFGRSYLGQVQSILQRFT